MTAPVVVFLGPSLELADARRELDAHYVGPAAQGDVLRALDARPAAIAIIDGYFARVPAVWHKELLWALAQGVRVYGAASMGALRAVELAPFGMVGVGRVFDGFRRGEYEDDDEVTVMHADAGAGYRPLSDAMVDLRATYARAAREQIVDEALAAELVARAKALPYPARTHAAALDAVARAGGDGAALERLRRWLPAGRVRQKRDDALELLGVLRRLVEAGPIEPHTPTFHFARTDAWEQLARQGGGRAAAPGDDPRRTAPLLDELRLAGRAAYRAAQDDALARALAAALARRHELVVDDALLGEAASRFFLEQGTLGPEAIQAWMAEQRLDAEALTRFLEREAPLHWARTLHAAEILEHLPDALRASGELVPLLLRARARRAALDELGGEQLVLDEAEAAELLTWYFTTRRGQPAPGDADTCAQVLGFDSGERLLRALLVERRLA